MNVLEYGVNFFKRPREPGNSRLEVTRLIRGWLVVYKLKSQRLGKYRRSLGDKARATEEDISSTSSSEGVGTVLLFALGRVLVLPSER